MLQKILLFVLLSGIICFFQVAELFARYGAVDVKPFTRFRALVAVGNHGRYVNVNLIILSFLHESKVYCKSIVGPFFLNL
jgi:hypothetical protein